ncbi:serine/threonine protein kinase-like protein [Lindgomyces ingoldianus]|uniref:Serine/threonine protein kinase-like protein n=1 Tax=Lindgomyces ingoldianus TaxID=673940 RepID=A0ACB6QB33_9PLEO|nr:serine/threonine protein kinase-like protein [Lindgomyces ingoldianus]KAF2464148.1 serine/threonine protein kinase-like protein [Lindgomyces ingoldianus]
MSWKLTQKFKETCLTPLANTFSGLSSPSTIDGNQPPKSSSSASSATLADSKDPNGVAASEANTTPPLPPLRPGILIVTLHEGKGFSLPAGTGAAFNTVHHHDPPSTGGGFSVAESMGPNSLSRNRAAGSYSSNRPYSAANNVNVIPTVHGRYSSRCLPYTLVDFDKLQVFINAVSGTPENPLWAGANTQYKFDVSRVTDLSVSLYIRNPSAPPFVGRNEDIFIGTCKLGTRSMKIGVNFVENRQDRLSIDDFELLKVVRRGSFGKVMQVMKKDTRRIYALKTLRKARIISCSEVAHTLAERSVLAQVDNPFIVPLKFSFQSSEKRYLVLAFVNCECLHGFNVIYRDLKPENILLDYTGHIALCDSGLCKLDMKDDDRTNTLCGTPEYLAPELLTGASYTKTVDWWTFGVLLYEMLTGLPPFYDENTNDMYRKILTEPLHLPGPDIVPPAARDLLTRLLDRNAEKRMGAKGASEIKAHSFFNSIDWRKLLEKYEPSFKPNVADAKDTVNFDREFTSEAPNDSYVDGPMLSQTMQQQFIGWSYNRPVAGLSDDEGSGKDPFFEGGLNKN